MEDERLKYQVAAGAKNFDSAYPGWADPDIVDLDRLNMDWSTFVRHDDGNSECGCVGSQLVAALPGGSGVCENWSEVRQHFQLWGRAAEDFGLWPDEEGLELDDEEHPLWHDGTIEDLWKGEILSRRER